MKDIKNNFIDSIGNTPLIKLKAAYEKKGHVYFSVSSFKGYGKLSNKKIDELKISVKPQDSMKYYSWLKH